jgi:hypothetical protein
LDEDEKDDDDDGIDDQLNYFDRMKSNQTAYRRSNPDDELVSIKRRRHQNHHFQYLTVIKFRYPMHMTMNDVTDASDDDDYRVSLLHWMLHGDNRWSKISLDYCNRMTMTNPMMERDSYEPVEISKLMMNVMKSNEHVNSVDHRSGLIVATENKIHEDDSCSYALSCCYSDDNYQWTPRYMDSMIDRCAPTIGSGV